MTYPMNHELIGSLPKLDCFRTSLPKLIAEYEGTRTLTDKFVLETNDRAELSKRVDEAFKDPSALDRMAKGVTIELCAQHFYGIDTEKLDSIGEVIAAIKAADQDLEFK